jgi:hypothetical protein
MLTLVTKADLEVLHTGLVNESLTLEYKDSRAIDKSKDDKKIEMARDVSAFANSDGGQIIYGMTENKNHEPAGLDSGIDGTQYPTIWFDQVLQQHIKPTIEGLTIRHIPLASPMVAVVIDIPASKGDPHQVSDGKYYRRHNFNRLPMEHYEIRDAMRRVTSPDLTLEFDLLVKQAAYRTIEFSKFRDKSDMTPLGAVVNNNSNQPAMHTFVSVYLDRSLKVEQPGLYTYYGEREFGMNDIRNVYTLKIGVPQQFPIFKEMKYMIDPLYFTISNRLLGHTANLGYELRAPGCFREKHGRLEFGDSGQMWLRI